MTAISIIYWSLVVSSGFYMFLMMVLNTGWYSLKGSKNLNVDKYTKVSIVVAVRNEEKNIAGLLESIEKQNYPKEKIEIIIVNDHSTDNTVGEIEKFIFETKRRLAWYMRLEKGRKSFEKVFLWSEEN